MKHSLRLLAAAALALLATTTPASASPAPVSAPWVLTLLLSLAPKPFAVPSLPETPEAYRARLAEIAEQVATRAYSSSEAALLVALAFKESGFAIDADKGPCDRHLGPTRCDSGRAASMWQLEIGDGETLEGWKKADVFADRGKAITVALRAVRYSLKQCGRHDGALDVYAGGGCATSPDSLIRVRGLERLNLARHLLAAHPPPRAALTPMGPIATRAPE